MSNREPSRVLAIGLDGAESTLIEKWMNDGSLPVLRSIRDNGAWGQLEGTRDFFSGSVWPTFLTGASVADHGFYSTAQLERTTGQLELMYGSSIGVPPFYTQLADAKKRVAVIDVPKMPAIPGMNGIQVAAWGSHSPANPPASDPPELLADLRRVYGEHPASAIDEDADPDDRYYRRLLRALREGCERRQSMFLDLLRREPWDLFIAVFSEAHSAGHKLWHLVDPDHPDFDPDAPPDLTRGLLQVYQDLDRAVGELKDASAANTTFLVFSVHGMGIDYNDAPTLLLPEFMRRYCGIDRTSSPDRPPLRARMFEMARRSVPGWMRNRIKHRMSLMTRARMRMLSFMEVHDVARWPQMRAFSLPSDDGGLIRINLKGREPHGIVAPEDYDHVCDEILERLMELRDPTLDCPAVERVTRVHAEHEGAFSDRLPDLFVQWAYRPLRALWSPTYGHLGEIQVHRAGSHAPRGFLLAEGQAVAPGSKIHGRCLDIPATILECLGEPMQRQTAGTSLLERQVAVQRAGA